MFYKNFFDKPTIFSLLVKTTQLIVKLAISKQKRKKPEKQKTAENKVAGNKQKCK